MNLSEIEKVVASLQNQLFKKANSYSVGMFKSSFKGAGLQFREHQIYNPGDDVRFIDWKLSAKSAGKTFIKTFEEDRNVEIVVAIDLSPTVFMGYKNISKLQMALEITCLLYLLAQETKDNVKVILFDKEILQLPSAAGREGIIFLISQLERRGLIDSNGKIIIQRYDNNYYVDEKKKISLLKSYVARKKEVVFMSDFYNYKKEEDIIKLVYNSNFTCFRLLCPLDVADKIPFSFMTSVENKKIMMFREKGISEQIDIVKEKRIKSLNVADRYLENFVKKMV